MRAKHIRALRQAVREFASWRGYHIGNPDPEPLQRFDRDVAAARAALKAAEEARALLLEYCQHNGPYASSTPPEAWVKKAQALVGYKGA